jgi:PAS domain-containing protein
MLERGSLPSWRYCGEPRPFRESDQRYLETLAAVLAAARQRRAGEQALERSEERLRVAQVAASVGTWEWDLTNQRMSWSDGLELLHELAPGTFPTTASGYLALVHPDDRESIMAAALAAESGDQRFDVRFRIMLADGRARWISARGQLFAESPGKPRRLVGVATDVTQQMNVEEAVRASEERFRMMANAAPVLIRVSSPAGMCVFVTERWSAFVGRPTESALGLGWLDSVHRTTARRAATSRGQRRAGGRRRDRVPNPRREWRVPLGARPFRPCRTTKWVGRGVCIVLHRHHRPATGRGSSAVRG